MKKKSCFFYARSFFIQDFIEIRNIKAMLSNYERPTTRG